MMYHSKEKIDQSEVSLLIWVSWIQWVWVWVCFAIATWQDLRTHYVYDWIWLVKGIGATILHFLAIYQVVLYSWSQVLASFSVTALFCGILWGISRITKIHFWGNADYLALLLFAYTIPSYVPLAQLQIIPREGILPLLDFLFNSVITMILISVGYFMRNIGGMMKTPIKSRKIHWFGEFQHLSHFSICRFLLIGHRVSISQLSKYTQAMSLEVFDETTEIWIPKRISQTLREDPYKMEQTWEYFLEITHKQNLQWVWISPYIPLMEIFWISSLITFLFGNWYWRIWFL